MSRQVPIKWNTELLPILCNRMKIRGNKIYMACSQKVSCISENEEFPCLCSYEKNKEFLASISNFLLVWCRWHSLERNFVASPVWNFNFKIYLQSLLIIQDINMIKPHWIELQYHLKKSLHYVKIHFNSDRFMQKSIGFCIPCFGQAVCFMLHSENIGSHKSITGFQGCSGWNHYRYCNHLTLTLLILVGIWSSSPFCNTAINVQYPNGLIKQWRLRQEASWELMTSWEELMSQNTALINNFICLLIFRKCFIIRLLPLLQDGRI